MIKTKLFILLLALSFTFSCKSTYKLKPTGEQISLNFKNGSKVLVELLSVQEQQLFFKKEGKLYAIPFEKITKLSVKGGHESESREGAYVGLGVANSISGIILVGAGGEGAGLGAALLGFGVVSFVAKKNSPYKFKFPLSMEKLNQLKLHSSYPLGLKPVQKQQLLLYYGQEEFFQL